MKNCSSETRRARENTAPGLPDFLYI
jgi:hypothetical protein